MKTLSRLMVTGILTSDTPRCVLEDVASAHGVNILTVEELNKVKGVKLKDNWPAAARYVNATTNWPLNKLKQALTFLTSMEAEKIPFPTNFVPGAQTPEELYNINPSLLYRQCRKLGVSLNSNSDITYMASAIKLTNMDTSVLRHRIQYLINEVDKVTLINMLLPAGSEILPSCEAISTVIEVTHEALKDCYNKLHNVPWLQKAIDPRTKVGSVALAAVIYKLDISGAQDPVVEYQQLRITGQYIPKDSWLRQWYTCNKDAFDLTKTFQPLFPKCYYEKETLKKLLAYNGCKKQRGDPYEQAQVMHLIPNFYLGPLHNGSPTTLYLESVESVREDFIICYGSYEGPLLSLQGIEMIELFETQMTFGNPFNSPDTFSEMAITKLSNLTKTIIETNTVKNIVLKAQRLANIIHLIKSNAPLDAIIRRLLKWYLRLDIEKQTLVIAWLRQLLDISMYMRGWRTNGMEEYPIQEAVVPIEYVGQVILNVSEAIAAFKVITQDKFYSELATLPLLIYKHNRFVISNHYQYGLTIMDRIELAATGTDTKNMESCIRVSSNWLASTAYKYLTALNQEVPFDINLLREIS